MVVNIGLELGLDLREHLFRDDEIYRDLVPVPDRLLSAHRTVGTTADQKPLLLDYPHHIHGKDARGVAYVQGTVNVETYQNHQIDPSLSK